MKSIEEGQLMLYCLKQALEHAKKQSESTYQICAGDQLRKVLPKLIEFVEKFEVGDKINLEVKKKGDPIAPGLPCKDKVELLMQRTEDQYEQIVELSRRVSDLEWKVGVAEKFKDLGWDYKGPRWKYDSTYYMNNPCYTKGPAEVTCAVPTNDVSRNMSDGSVAQAQTTTDWRSPEPQTDAIPDAPPEREA